MIPFYDKKIVTFEKNTGTSASANHERHHQFTWIRNLSKNLWTVCISTEFVPEHIPKLDTYLVAAISQTGRKNFEFATRWPKIVTRSSEWKSPSIYRVILADVADIVTGHKIWCNGGKKFDTEKKIYSNSRFKDVSLMVWSYPFIGKKNLQLCNTKFSAKRKFQNFSIIFGNLTSFLWLKICRGSTCWNICRGFVRQYAKCFIILFFFNIFSKFE